MSRGSIPTQWPDKGDLVPGHRVWAYAPGLPAVPGRVVSATAATVTVELDTILAVLGLPKRSTWTWRGGPGRYQQKGTSGRKAMSLLLDRRPKGKGK